MARLIAHRGPDEGRVWCDSRGRVALGKVLMLQL
jgi:asparagine synthetase B (glutamine-hydrolysing)